MSVIAETPGRTAHRGQRRGARSFALGTALALIAFAPSAAASERDASVGGGEAIAWTTQYVAPGVEVRSGVLSAPEAVGVWTVTVQAPAVNRLTGAATWAPLGDRSWADTTTEKLRGPDSHRAWSG